MKKAILILVGVLLVQYSNSQSYFPFPTDTSEWNSLTKALWAPEHVYYINSLYKIQGDTILSNTTYNKVFYSESPTSNYEYIGGLREDSNKQIYFYPFSTQLPNYCASEFPSDTTEFLLYTFDSLTPGMILPINSEATEIKVIEIDSIFVGDSYRKRYEIQQDYMGSPQYWIEGIGSDKDLFAPFSIKFEWELYTLCFSDTLRYYINSPNGEDSCHYWVPVGLTEVPSDNFVIYPNPASQTIKIETDIIFKSGIVNIYNNYGQVVITNEFINSKEIIDIHHLESGIYFVEVYDKNRKLISKVIME